MCEWLANRNDEPCIGEDSSQKLDSRDVVIFLGEVPNALAQQQDFAQMVAEEGDELGVVRGGRQPVQRRGRMNLREKMLPDRLFKRLGTIDGDLNPVFVGPFDGRGVSGESVDEPVPEDRRHEERKIAVAMRRHSGNSGELLEQNRRPRACQAGQKDRPVDPDRFEFAS